jgi:hypothetical protein
LTSQQALWNRRKRQGAIQRVQLRVLFTCPAQRCKLVFCNAIFNLNAMRTLPDLGESICIKALSKLL